MFFSILLHNCKNIISSPAGIVNQAVFLVILLSIFAFFGVESPVIGYNLIWMSLLFAMMLNMNEIFADDFNDGSLQQLYLTGYMFEIAVLAKILANWLVYFLAMLILMPIIFLMFTIDFNLLNKFVLIFILASLIISFVLAFAASVNLSARESNFLPMIIILPLILPLLIFANNALVDLENFNWYFLLILAILAFLAPIFVVTITYILKINFQ